MTTRPSLAWLLACWGLLACSAREVELAPQLSAAHDGAGDVLADGALAIPGLRALRITPGEITVTYDGTALSESPVFSAIGSFDDGERDVTARVGWSLSRPALGQISGGRFQTAAIGGTADVMVRAGDVSANAALRVDLQIAIQRGSVDDDDVARFASAGSLDQVFSAEGQQLPLQIVYPADGTVLPSNLAYVRTQWHAPAGFDRFELTITGPHSQLRYYTDQLSWLDDVVSSRYFAPSHVGGSLTMTLRTFASSEPETVYRAPLLQLAVADVAADGGVYYWSSTARGIKRGHLAADIASRVTSEAADAGPAGCAGCHALSRDGTRLAVSNQMQKLGMLALPEQTELTFSAVPPSAAEPASPEMPATPMMPGMPGKAEMPVPTPPKKAVKPRDAPDYGWGTFNPAGTRLLYADKGKLRLIDVVTGEAVGNVELPPGAAAVHPDWAPDGRAVAVTYWTAEKKQTGNKQVQGSSIARLAVRDDGTLAAPEVLVASAGPDDTLLYPSYAPDGRWLAFVRAQGPAKDSSDAQVYLVAADGTGEPLALAQLNGGVLTNTMPTWLPTIRDGIGFITFSSQRDYGDILVGAQRDQLWAAAIDFDQLSQNAGALDASSPAFWLPFQDVLENNHRALWSASTSDVCPAWVELCNGRDDDCDGVSDEMCCTPTAEVCGDGVDNDCDGVADEGCNCADVDVCDNQLDDDCDQQVDEDCRD